MLVAAALAGWVSGSHPSIAAVARFGAIATAAGAGLQFSDPAIGAAALAGGALAIAVTFAGWWITGVPAADNAMDWRAGLRLALAGANAGPWFAICYAAACAIALFAASELGVARPYWATVTVMMVMRREGLMSLQLVIHYMVGTLVGILAAAAIERAVRAPLVLALLGTAFAAFARFGTGAESGAGVHRVHRVLHARGRPRGGGLGPGRARAVHPRLRRGGGLRHRARGHARHSRSDASGARSLRVTRRACPRLSSALPTSRRGTSP